MLVFIHPIIKQYLFCTTRELALPKPKLLVMDDEPGIQEMIANHFSLRGFEVATAGDGEKGIEQAKTFQPDIVLLDLKMKKMDGDAALPELRELLPKSKIFVVSACDDEIAAKRLAGLYVDGRFQKPASILEIEKAIRCSLGLR